MITMSTTKYIKLLILYPNISVSKQFSDFDFWSIVSTLPANSRLLLKFWDSYNNNIIHTPKITSTFFLSTTKTRNNIIKNTPTGTACENTRFLLLQHITACVILNSQLRNESVEKLMGINNGFPSTLQTVLVGGIINGGTLGITHDNLPKYNRTLGQTEIN